jgi:hypothetical protein
MKRTEAVLALVIGALATGAVRPTPVAPARVAPITFDPSKIRLAQDSFAVVVTQLGQSMPAGTEVVTVHKDGTKLLFDEAISAAAIGLTGTLTIASGAGMEPLGLISHATLQGLSLTDSVTVQNGRATGSTQSPSGPGTVKTAKVDASVAAGLLLDKDLLIALLPTAELSEGMTASLSMLDEQSGTIVPLTLTVEGTETITVPAGRFDAVRVHAKSTEDMVAYVSIAAPRRVVRINYSDAGIELRLLK